MNSDILSQILDELKTLKADVQSLKTNNINLQTKSEKLKIHFSLDKLDNERKPYVLNSDGIFHTQIKISNIRAAIFLVLLLDLQDRLFGGPGLPNVLETINEFYEKLEPNINNEGNVKSLIRVALYRFELFINEIKEFKEKSIKLVYKTAKPSLEFISEESENIELMVSSTDPKILELLQKSSLASPLTKLRKHKSSYIPSGPEGWDRLFWEFFNHSNKVVNTSLFNRFSISTYPVELLKAIGVSDVTYKRRNIMLEGYKNGRVGLNEYATRQTLHDLITKNSQGYYKLYPKISDDELVRKHLINIIELRKNMQNYSLNLTSAPFPFILGIVEIYNQQEIEKFTLFYRNYYSQDPKDLNCFALCDNHTTENVKQNIIGNIATHPSTTRDKDEVILELKETLTRFETDGPIIE